MYENLDLFRTAGAMAHHAGRRQAVVATNVANADTPGYRAQAIPSFQDTYRAGPTSVMKATRAGHLAPQAVAQQARDIVLTGEPSPNGNTVSLEDEMLNAVSVSREHSRALSIYRHTMTVLRTALGRG